MVAVEVLLLEAAAVSVVVVIADIIVAAIAVTCSYRIRRRSCSGKSAALDSHPFTPREPTPPTL